MASQEAFHPRTSGSPNRANAVQRGFDVSERQTHAREHRFKEPALKSRNHARCQYCGERRARANAWDYESTRRYFRR